MAMRTQNEALQASSPAQDPGQQQPAQLGARGRTPSECDSSHYPASLSLSCKRMCCSFDLPDLLEA